MTLKILEMFKKIFSLSILLVLFFSLGYSNVYAQSNSFVTVVNPIRGLDFWDSKEGPDVVVSGQLSILRRFQVPATFLIRYDALNIQKITDLLKPTDSNIEKGLFLEITPSLTTRANVEYRKSNNWHSAGSVFLTGYTQTERDKIIDTAFDGFKQTYGYFPKSVGAWWVDSYSLNYMQKKYAINTSLIVADQYSTDNYQIWGQFFGAPYYPALKDALNPAPNKENKIPVVLIQWAARDPVNGYGKGVEESTYSVQANDYIDYHNLNTSYFGKLVEIYTNQKFNQVNQLVVGLENSYSWDKYKSEYENQIKLILTGQQKGQYKLTTMDQFGSWYKSKFTDISPPHLIVANDPLNTEKKVVWFMNQHYRVGWFYNQLGSVIRDIRQYLEGAEEICYQKACDNLNFATFETRVLDEVTYNQRWLIDEGRIADIKISETNSVPLINYTNQAGQKRAIEFLPRDISVNGKVSTIDGAILDNTVNAKPIQKSSVFLDLSFKQPIFLQILGGIKFLTFIIFALFLPGFLIVKKFITDDNNSKVFVSICFGIASLSLVSFLSALIFKNWILSVLFILISIIVFVYKKAYKDLPTLKIDLVALAVIITGSIFQTIATFRSGLIYGYGLGFWGPNGHDGVWHLALINAIQKGIPVQNPILSNTFLSGYHFFYDLLVALTSTLTFTPSADLLFRFYPLFISLLLGLGVYCVLTKFLKSHETGVNEKIAVIFSLYLVYFAGSFGWIVDYIRKKSFEGESAFWANQTVSFNLNPPFAISFVLILALIVIFYNINRTNKISVLVAALILGSLYEFKAYAAILVFISLGIIILIKLFKGDRDYHYLIATICGGLVSLLLFVPNIVFSRSASESLLTVFIFSPFWFIHSMIDASDRVAWERLALTRTVGLADKNWFKFLGAETVGLVIFTLGNLGVRLISLFLILKSYKYLKDLMILFLALISLLGFIIPLLFIQKGTPWNTIQFFYYSMYIAAIFSGLVIGYLFKKIPLLLAIIITTTLVIITPINSFTVAKGYFYEYPHAFVSSLELSGLNFLSSKKDDGVILTYPYDKALRQLIREPYPLYAYDTSSYVSALSNHPTYIEDAIQQSILQLDDKVDIGSNIVTDSYKKRLVQARDFFKGREEGWSREFLVRNNIKYIYIPKINRISLDFSKIGVTSIFVNDDVEIFQVN